jgi:hypothetical protein
MTGMMLYRSFDVYKRTETAIVRYRCFQTIPDGYYCVQSADFYRENTNRNFPDDQFIELLAEVSPEQRSPAFATIEEAIAHHDSEFSDKPISN